MKISIVSGILVALAGLGLGFLPGGRQDSPPAPRRLIALSSSFVEVQPDPSATCRCRKTTDASAVLRLGKVTKAPRVAVYDGQLSNTQSITESFAYIRRIDATCPADGGPALYEPVISVCHVGFGVEYRPVVAPDGVRLALTFRIWERAPEMRTVETPQGRLQDPGARSVDYDLKDLLLAPGEVLVLGPVQGPIGKAPARYLVLSAELLPATDTAEGETKDYPLPSSD